MAAIGKSDMRYSLESLDAFAQAAALGSFSAAARRLGKSQSTISEAVARLEIDLGVTLFERRARQLQLTAAGQVLLVKANDVLKASDGLVRSASRMIEGLESKLTLVLSDTYHSDQYENYLYELGEQFPELEFECIMAEHADVIDLIVKGRADLGLLEAQTGYLPEIGHATLKNPVEFALYAAPNHALARLSLVSYDDLASWRELRINTLVGDNDRLIRPAISGSRWYSTSYLLLLEMAVAGLGWAALPCWLVDGYAGERLQRLRMNGWPRSMAVDMVWSRERRLGLAGHWLLEKVLKH